MLSRLMMRLSAAIMAVTLVLSSALPVSAATLTGRSDVMSDQNVGDASNHQIRFITPTGVDANTDTITISFSTGFNLTSILFSDIALSHGASTGFETSETVAASAAAGVWGAAVSGQTITLTAPTDAAGGEIPASDIVVVRIGTNAGGTHRIINPSGGGGSQMYVSIGGTFGDTGGLDLPFANNPGNASISISATVAASSTPGGGGGGGGTSGDLTAPTIFNIVVNNITTSTASVSWETSEPATTVIDWGTDTLYTLGHFSNGTLTLGHTVPLSGLPNGTLIHFRLTAADASGNTGQSPDQTFTTLTSSAAPIISNVRVTGITDTSAVLEWDTNIPANSTVHYGTTPAYGSTGSNGAFVTSHSLILNGLTPSTLYHFNVSSAEAGGLNTTTGDFTFSTQPDLTPPTNVFNFTATPNDSSNSLHWENPSDADFSFVRIRARTDGFPLNPNDGRLVYEGNGTDFVDGGLINGVTYFYANFAFDGSGNHASGAYAQATPSGPPPVTPPVTPPPVTPPTTPPTGPGGGGSTTTPPVRPPVTPPGSATTTPPVTTTTTPPVIIPPVTTTTTPPIRPGVNVEPSYFAGAGSIELPEDAQGIVVSIPGIPVLVRIPTGNFPSTPVAGTIRVGNNTYALTPLPGGTAWGASFVPARQTGNVPVTIIFTFNDGSQASKTNTIALVSGGRILERSALGTLQPVEGATVEIYEQTATGWQLWNSGRYGQANRITTGASGGYSFLVPNGQYRIVASKDGYVTQEKILNVTRNVASDDIVLPIVVALPIIGPVLETLQSEPARQAASVIAPVVVAIALANLAAGASLFSLFNYLWFLMTQPFLLFNRKKRTKWGVVYNSLSKAPIDLVAVRLIHAETRLVIQTRITDNQGRFVFQAKPGTYRIEAVRAGFVFPSVYLKDDKEDGEMLDIYHGEPISVTEQTEIAVNVPMDPIEKTETPRQVIWKRWFRRFQYAFSSLSLFITLGALIIAPSWLMLGLFVLQVLTFLLFLRLAKPKKPKGWGIVYDLNSRKPLGSAVVRIFDKKFNKLLETQVTNAKGEYGFFAQKNVYFVTAEKNGYDKYKTDDLDLVQNEQSVIDAKIPLKKGN